MFEIDNVGLPRMSQYVSAAREKAVLDLQQSQKSLHGKTPVQNASGENC